MKLKIRAQDEHPLILREIAAMRIRLSHASHLLYCRGGTLSNTSVIYPMVKDKHGKLCVTLDSITLQESEY